MLVSAWAEAKPTDVNGKQSTPLDTAICAAVVRLMLDRIHSRVLDRTAAPSSSAKKEEEDEKENYKATYAPQPTGAKSTTVVPVATATE